MAMVVFLALGAHHALAAAEVPEVKTILAEAQQTVIVAPDDVWKAVSLFSIAETQTKIGDQAGAARTSQALRDVMATFQEGLERSFAEYFVQMARVQASVKLGLIQEALQTAARIKDDYQRAEVLRTLALQQAKAGDRAGAAKTFAHALEAALGVEGKSQLVIAVQFVAGAQAEAGQTGAARQTLARLDEYDKQGGLREIALGQARGGDVKGALETIEAIQNPTWKSTAIRQVVSAQLRSGDVDAALRTASLIEWDATKAGALREIVQAQAAAGNVAGALRTTAGIKDKKEIAIAMGAVALAQARAGDAATATKTFQAALQAAATVGSEIDRSLALAAIAEAQARSGDVVSSAKTLARIPAEHRDVYARELANVHAESGAFKSAVEIAGTIQLEPTRARAAAAIATTQAKTGHVIDALDWAERLAAPIVKASALIGVAAGMLERTDTVRNDPKRAVAAAPSPQAGPEASRAPEAPKSAPPRRDVGPAGTGGLLIVEARPADAQVFLDGELLGTAAQLVAHGLPISAGKHVVQIVAPGFKRHSTQFVTDPSFPVRIRVALTPE